MSFTDQQPRIGRVYYTDPMSGYDYSRLTIDGVPIDMPGDDLSRFDPARWLGTLDSPALDAIRDCYKRLHDEMKHKAQRDLLNRIMGDGI